MGGVQKSFNARLFCSARARLIGPKEPVANTAAPSIARSRKLLNKFQNNKVIIICVNQNYYLPSLSPSLFSCYSCVHALFTGENICSGLDLPGNTVGVAAITILALKKKRKNTVWIDLTKQKAVVIAIGSEMKGLN